MYRIRCINKTNRASAHERISHIGGLNDNNTRWRLTLAEGVRMTEEAAAKGQVAFYIEQGGSRVNVVVAVSALGHKYLKTVADGEQPDNLLSLPECPA